MALRPGDLDDGKFAIGKGACFIQSVYDFDTNLTTRSWTDVNSVSQTGFVYLGFTEGEIENTKNETFNGLTLPEYTGEVEHEANVSGERPEVTIPIFTADPALAAILSATGSRGGGGKRQRPVQEYTLWILPEELFLDVSDPTLQEDLELTWDAVENQWELGGVALTSDQNELMDLGTIIWRGYFMKPRKRFRWEEAGKLVEPVTFRSMYQSLAPVGSRIYYDGDPSDIILVETGAHLES